MTIERESKGIRKELARMLALACHVGSFSRASLTRVIDNESPTCCVALVSPVVSRHVMSCHVM